jgi:23S rRNA (guanosine2251-2'-O)-methyltransferase
MLYGRQAVHEALRAGRRQLFRLTVAETVRATQIVGDILASARIAGVEVARVPRRHLDSLGDVNHQGVMLEAGAYPYVNVDEILAASRQQDEPPFLLIVDLVKDPQNLGSLLRTADAAGVHGVVIQRRRAASVTPAAVRASSGAAEHLRVAQVTNLVNVIGGLKARDIWVAGLESTSGAERYDQARLDGSLALVVGSEGRGLRRLVRERCDFLVELPMRGRVTSLNAAVAGSIVMYEAWRQRQVAASR